MRDALLDPATDELPMPADYMVAESYDELSPSRNTDLEATLREGAPMAQPVPLSRQAARRMAIQLCWARLQGTGLPRAERRRLMFDKKTRIFNYSDIARGLVGMSSSQNSYESVSDR